MQKDPVDITIGNLVAKIRGTKGVSREDLGRALNLNARQVGRLERGETHWKCTQLTAISALLEVDAKTFAVNHAEVSDTTNMKTVINILLDDAQHQEIEYLNTLLRTLIEMRQKP